MLNDIYTLTVENFDQLAVRSPEPVMVGFTAPWCPDCRRLTAALQALAVRYRGTVRFGLVNVEQQPKLACLLGAGGLPSTLLLQDGRVYTHAGGALPLSHYEKLLDRMLAGKPPHPER